MEYRIDYGSIGVGLKRLYDIFLFQSYSTLVVRLFRLHSLIKRV